MRGTASRHNASFARLAAGRTTSSPRAALQTELPSSAARRNCASRFLRSSAKLLEQHREAHPCQRPAYRCARRKAVWARPARQFLEARIESINREHPDADIVVFAGDI